MRNTNQYVVMGDITKIITVKGDEILIDTDMINKTKRYCWYISSGKHNKNYVRSETRSNDPGGGGKLIMLANLLLPPNKGEQIDHINLNTLDNRLANLRRCTIQENCCNRSLRSDNNTGYKGVQYRRGAYIVRVCSFGVRKNILQTKDIVEAAQAYNIAAELLHLDFANLNDVPPPSEKLKMFISKRVCQLFGLNVDKGTDISVCRWDNKTGLRNVSKVKDKERYVSYIIPYPQRRIHLGYYSTAEEAAQAYNVAAGIFYDNKAKLNDLPAPTDELRNRVVDRLNKTGGFIMPEMRCSIE
jgi:hypothetical protein